MSNATEMMNLLSISFLLITASLTEQSDTYKPHESCERSYRKIGCFYTSQHGERTDLKDMQMLLNDRDIYSEKFEGHLIDWHKMNQSMHSLACRCAQKAKELNLEYISIRFWGECYGGKDFSAFRHLIQDNDKWRSNDCSNPYYQPCVDDATHDCAGGAGSDYIYAVGVDGGLSEWSDWAECGATCGKGIQERFRTCTNPIPEGPGKPCEGDLTQTKECTMLPCKVDGGLSEWTEFGPCSQTCRGVSTRTRSCTNPPPSGGGELCTGHLLEAKACGAVKCE